MNYLLCKENKNKVSINLILTIHQQKHIVTIFLVVTILILDYDQNITVKLVAQSSTHYEWEIWYDE
jgi:hypothetical protein